MNVGNRKLKGFVDRLLELSKTDGVVDVEKVEAVLKTLVDSKMKSLKTVLQLYRFSVRKEILSGTAKISHSGTITEIQKDELKATLESRSGRPLTLEFREDPDLIAGVKIAVGDYVYDHSVRGALQNLSQI